MVIRQTVSAKKNAVQVLCNLYISKTSGRSMIIDFFKYNRCTNGADGIMAVELQPLIFRRALADHERYGEKTRILSDTTKTTTTTTTTARLVCNDVGGLSRPRSSNNTSERRGDRPISTIFLITAPFVILFVSRLVALHPVSQRLASDQVDLYWR